jgi:hypothetical protein
MLTSNELIINDFKNIFKKSLNDKQYMLKVLDILNKYKINNFSDFINKHVMYMYIMTELYNDLAIIKIGYTFNIINRYKSLCNDYKCNFILIGIKNINSESDEIMFHNYMKTLTNKYNIKYNSKLNKTKLELYKLDEEVINEFNNFKVVLIEQEKTKQIEYQEKTKQELEQEKTKQIEYQEKTKQIEYQEKTKQKQEQEKTKQIEYQEKTKQIEYQEKTKQEQEKTKQEIEKTKQLKLELKILKLKNK